MKNVQGVLITPIKNEFIRLENGNFNSSHSSSVFVYLHESFRKFIGFSNKCTDNLGKKVIYKKNNCLD